MPDTQHLLERRAQLLGSKLKGRVGALTQALRPSGQRPPFTEQLSKPEALSWWRLHLHDQFGQQVLQNMDPASQIELQLALSQQTAEDRLAATAMPDYNTPGQ